MITAENGVDVTTADGSVISAEENEARWAEILDGMAAQLERAERALAAGGLVELPRFVPPAGVGTIPLALAGRAAAVLAATRAVAARVQQRAEAVRIELTGVQRTNSARQPASAALLDRSI